MQHETIRELFDRALDVPAADRRRFLHDACGGDTTLHASVEGLLLAHERAGGFFADPVVTSDQVLPPGDARLHKGATRAPPTAQPPDLAPPVIANATPEATGFNATRLILASVVVAGIVIIIFVIAEYLLVGSWGGP